MTSSKYMPEGRPPPSPRQGGGDSCGCTIRVTPHQKEQKQHELSKKSFVAAEAPRTQVRSRPLVNKKEVLHCHGTTVTFISILCDQLEQMRGVEHCARRHGSSCRRVARSIKGVHVNPWSMPEVCRIVTGDETESSPRQPGHLRIPRRRCVPG